MDARGDVKSNRWWQLLFGIACMAMIANLQYGWTLFVNPLADKFHWEKAAIQVAFTIFVLAETWLVPVEGYLVDRFGPRFVTLVGGILVAVAWAINSVADSLTVLYVAAAIGGVGAGAVYGTCVGNALKWFPDHRGLAAGLTAAGFGAGSALTIIPIASMIKSRGYEATFLYFGIGQGLIVFILGWLLRQPSPAELASLPKPQRRSVSGHDFTPIQMIKTPVFWVLYLMFVLMAAGGLMATAQLAPIAKDFKIADVPVSIAGLTLPALTFALSLDRILNGLTRPFFGWVSDRIGRENTMFIAFVTEGVGILLLSKFGQDPVALRRPDGVGVLRLGRDLQPLPVDVRRQLRIALRRRQRRPPLHRQGDGLAPRALLEHPRQVGRLAHGVRRRRGHEHRRRAPRPRRLEAAQEPPEHRRRTGRGRSRESMTIAPTTR